jgi:hypothetical protein
MGGSGRNWKYHCAFWYWLWTSHQHWKDNYIYTLHPVSLIYIFLFVHFNVKNWGSYDNIKPQQMLKKHCKMQKYIRNFNFETHEVFNHHYLILYLSILLHLYSFHTQYIQSTMELFPLLLLTTCFGYRRPSSVGLTMPKLSHCVTCIKCSLIYTTCKCDASCLKYLMLRSIPICSD